MLKYIAVLIAVPAVVLTVYPALAVLDPHSQGFLAALLFFAMFLLLLAAFARMAARDMARYDCSRYVGPPAPRAPVVVVLEPERRALPRTVDSVALPVLEPERRALPRTVDSVALPVRSTVRVIEVRRWSWRRGC